MRCPECGANGYSRKTKTPEWRCRNCGYEWDADSDNRDNQSLSDSSWLDREIDGALAMLGRRRAVRVARGKASNSDVAWFLMGFGRGRFAILMMLGGVVWLSVLGVLKVLSIFTDGPNKLRWILDSLKNRH